MNNIVVLLSSAFGPYLLAQITAVGAGFLKDAIKTWLKVEGSKKADFPACLFIYAILGLISLVIYMGANQDTFDFWYIIISLVILFFTLIGSFLRLDFLRDEIEEQKIKEEKEKVLQKKEDEEFRKDIKLVADVLRSPECTKLLKNVDKIIKASEIIIANEEALKETASSIHKTNTNMQKISPKSDNHKNNEKKK